MKQIQLPDGSYIHPTKIEKFGVAKHFLSSNYYVFAKLRNGQETDVAENLSLTKAKEIRTWYEEELEKLHLESSPYNDGKEEDYEIGYAEGRGQGIEEGKNRAEQINWNQAERNGIEAVLADIRARIEELYTELNYDIKDERRRCVESTITILSGILERFEPPPPEEELFEDSPSQVWHSAGASQATVPISAGIETSISSKSSDAQFSLWTWPPGMSTESPASSRTTPLPSNSSSIQPLTM